MLKSFVFKVALKWLFLKNQTHFGFFPYSHCSFGYRLNLLWTQKDMKCDPVYSISQSTVATSHHIFQGAASSCSPPLCGWDRPWSKEYRIQACRQDRRDLLCGTVCPHWQLCYSAVLHDEINTATFEVQPWRHFLCWEASAFEAGEHTPPAVSCSPFSLLGGCCEQLYANWNRQSLVEVEKKFFFRLRFFIMVGVRFLARCPVHRVRPFLNRKAVQACSSVLFISRSEITLGTSVVLESFCFFSSLHFGFQWRTWIPVLTPCDLILLLFQATGCFQKEYLLNWLVILGAGTLRSFLPHYLLFLLLSALFFSWVSWGCWHSRFLPSFVGFREPASPLPGLSLFNSQMAFEVPQV